MGADFASELNQSAIDSEHLLYGLLNQKGSVGAELFNDFKIDIGKAKKIIASISGSQVKKGNAGNKAKSLATKISEKTDKVFTPNAQKIIHKSVKIAFINKHKYVGTEHLLAAIMEIEDLKIKNILSELNIPEKDIIEQTITALKSDSKLPELTEIFKVVKEKNDDGEIETLEQSRGILDIFGNNLTSEKFQKKTDPVIGRENEIERIIQILSRRTKNNPLILGDPGVGKTAIVEGLAKKILHGDVPELLQNKKIYALDLASLIAGTIYRGEFENRLKQIIEEIKSRPDIIIFIDEIHTIVGAGSAAGSMDAANILKPALARGEIRCIGATTFSDYRKSIENDPALERRFQPVKINEPSADESRQILMGIKPYFENFHHVAITDEAIDSAIELSQKYLPEKFLPDKAIDLIDEALAGVSVAKKTSTLQKQINSLALELNKIEKAKNQSILKEDFDSAIDFRAEEKKIIEKLSGLQAKQDKIKARIVGSIDTNAVAKIISKITGIPQDDLLMSERKQILGLDQELTNHIIGQDKAIENISNFIKRAKAGLSAENKPLASFMILGPSGVGKTYTAKILAKLLFKDEKALIRIDMSEYSEKFNISKLIGAPAGYVGYKESGQLTEKVKHKPYSIVLFDEIEKANPEVFDLLLQVLDDGYLTDAAGGRINFRNTIIIMTSNLGSHYFKKVAPIGFDSTTATNAKIEEKIIGEAKKHFKIEFLNRLDQIICFSPLSTEAIDKIVELSMETLRTTLTKKGLGLKFDKSVSKFIADKSLSEETGARTINKTIQEYIETPLSQKILADNFPPGSTIHLTVKNGIIEVR